MTAIYSTGTVSVTNGNAAVTGAGTGWAVSLVEAGMFSCDGFAVPILSVASDTSLTLAYPWPGTTGAGKAYAIALENAVAANVVDLAEKLTRVLINMSLVGVHPNDSGTIADRNALVLDTNDEGFIFLHAEFGVAFVFYRWTGTAWVGPFDTRGVAGVGAGGLGLPTPGAANKFPYYSAANTIVLGDITLAGRNIIDDADASAQLTTLGFSTFMKTLVDDADAATLRASIGLTVGTSGSVVPKLDGANIWSGTQIINKNTAPLVSGGAATVLQLGAANGVSTSLTMDGFQAVAQTAYRRANGTAASPAGVGAGELLGAILFQGYVSASYTGAVAAIRSYSAEAFTASAQGSNIDFLTTPIGSNVAGIIATFRYDGSLNLIGQLDLSNGAGQVKFPASQNPSSNANTFDDYEEGTFTPTIIGTGTAGTGTYSVQVGHYVKMACRVHFDINLTWSAHTGTTGMKVGGVPFTSGARETPCAINYQNLTVTNVVQAYMESAATTIALVTVATNAARAALAMDTAASLNLSGSFSVI